MVIALKRELPAGFIDRFCCGDAARAAVFAGTTEQASVNAVIQQVGSVEFRSEIFFQQFDSAARAQAFMSELNMSRAC
jgi:hypothetical protein